MSNYECPITANCPITLSDYTVQLHCPIKTLQINISANYSSLCTNHIWGIVIVMIIINTPGQITNRPLWNLPFRGPTETGDARADNSFATLILIGCRDVKQLRLANEILRKPFRCQSWREFVLAHFVALCSVELEILFQNERSAFS